MVLAARGGGIACQLGRDLLAGDRNMTVPSMTSNRSC
jgi:hypothetical protein